ncbi:MAG: glycyl-radical enzyme activating protein [Actinomycetota bacterium]|nr:glycyl-radical enzyme activating protein [Actinomycetota bacterium]
MVGPVGLLQVVRGHGVPRVDCKGSSMGEIMGTVFNIQRYSIDDGPGIRSTVFLKGCPLNCKWCSNPESQNRNPEISHRDSLCSKCGICVQVCEAAAITVDEAGVHIDRDRCNVCGKCIDACDREVLELMGRSMTVEEVFSQLQRDTDYYESSGGGVTICGGEALYQPEFTFALLKRCREVGIHTCLDTAGYGTSSALQRILQYTSLVFYDIKHLDARIHRELTGKQNGLIMRNLELIIRSGVPVVIRVPYIPGHNDSKENIEALAKTVSGMSKEAKVNLLPYHRFGMGKYAMLDRRYELAKLLPPSKEDLSKAKEIIESFGLACEVAV